MATFHVCAHCDKEFLGTDEVPESENAIMVCFRCYHHYEVCIVCRFAFPLGQTDYEGGDMCQSCYDEWDGVNG